MARTPPEPSTFIYDADCGMCASTVRLLRRLDWRGRISWTSSQSLDTSPPGLSWKDLDRSAYLQTPAGDLHEGFFAIRELLLRLPVAAPIGALMRLPGVSKAGVPAYRWIARHRHRISGCKTPTASKPAQVHPNPPPELKRRPRWSQRQSWL